MTSNLKNIADILTNIAFIILTLTMAYFNLRLSNLRISEKERLMKQDKYNKYSGILLVSVSLLFIIAVVIQIYAAFTSS